jgi:hypothetical protein
MVVFSFLSFLQGLLFFMVDKWTIWHLAELKLNEEGGGDAGWVGSGCSLLYEKQDEEMIQSGVLVVRKHFKHRAATSSSWVFL